MKRVMDEKLKHRLIGLAVIISLGAIFAPAVMKKSNQRLESNFTIRMKLPPKPLAPNVVIKDEKDLYKTIKVAKIKMPPVSEEQLPDTVKAEPIAAMPTQQELVVLDKQPKGVETQSIIEPVRLALHQETEHNSKKIVQIATATKGPVQDKKSSSMPIRQQNVYAVQLASFTQLTNAQNLVNRLHAKGYKANFVKSSNRQGPIYKVYVGHSIRKLDVMKLKTRLASAMQLNGFVVNTGVS